MKYVAKTAIAVSGMALWVAVGAVAPAVVHASPSSTLTEQDSDSGHDGAAIDYDGTVGSYKPAMDGNQSGPLMVAAPQFKAGK